MKTIKKRCLAVLAIVVFRTTFDVLLQYRQSASAAVTYSVDRALRKASYICLRIPHSMHSHVDQDSSSVSAAAIMGKSQVKYYILSSSSFSFSSSSSSSPRSGVLRTRTLDPELKGSPQNIAMHASPTARDFLFEPISFFLVHSPSFFPNLSVVLPVLTVAHAGSCVGPQNKTGHPAHCHRWLMYWDPCWVPTKYK